MNHCRGSRQGVTERRVVEGSVKTEPSASTRAVSKRLGPSDRFDLLSTRSIQACSWSLQALSQKPPTSLTESALGLNPFVSDASALVLSTKRKTSCPCSKGAQVSSATGAAKISNLPICVFFGIHDATTSGGTASRVCNSVLDNGLSRTAPTQYCPFQGHLRHQSEARMVADQSA